MVSPEWRMIQLDKEPERYILPKGGEGISATLIVEPIAGLKARQKRQEIIVIF